MASAQDNDIVIECSPYSDSETEIRNLKSMSYELIPTIGDIFTTSETVSNFVLTFSIAGGLLVAFLLILYIKNIIKQPSDGVWMTTSLNVLYFVLFIIGFIISNSENDKKMLTTVYIAFGVTMFFVIGITGITLYDKHKKNVNDKMDGIAIANLIFPGLVQTSYAVNNGLFVIGFILLYLVISLIRRANQIKSKSDWEQAFSPIVLLGSYCFLQVLNYLYRKLQESTNNSNQSNPENPNINN